MSALASIAAIGSDFFAVVKSLPAVLTAKLDEISRPAKPPRFDVAVSADPFSPKAYVVDRELGREYPATGRSGALALLDVLEDDPSFGDYLNYFPLGCFTKETR